MIAPEPQRVLMPRPISPAERRPAWCSGEGPRRPALRVHRPLAVLPGDLPRIHPAHPPRSQPCEALRRCLDAFPRTLAGLRAAGVAVEPASDEEREAYLNRMGTSLMALFRDTGDRETFNALYHLTRESILVWIKSLLARGNQALDPSELLQDTFVNVYRYPRSFRAEQPGSFRVWVRTIAGNLIRRAGTQRARYSFQALPEGLQEPSDASQNPANLAAAVDESRILVESWNLFLLLYAEAWKELSQRDRRTLHLVEVEGLSYEEAGRILGVGRSNMKMIVFRSRKRIARRIERALAASRLSAAGLEVA